MSSHHIVREKQEPALLIANGEECSSVLLNQLLEWSPYIVVLDGALDRVLHRGVKIDVLLGDFDSTSADLNELKKDQYPIEIIPAPDQEKTDLEKGIEFLIEREFPAVNIVWATGKRMDHTLSNVTNLVKYKDRIKLKMLDDHSIITPLLPGATPFTKWYTKGTVISLIPVQRAVGIHTENLVYPLTNEDLSLGYRIGNSNEVAADGTVKIWFTSGELLLIESQD